MWSMLNNPNPDPCLFELTLWYGMVVVGRYLVVVINKMDDPTVKWAKDRFDECVTKIRPFLRQQCGYAVKKEVKFIPISGLSGANVKDQVRSMVGRLTLQAVLRSRMISYRNMS